MMLELRREDGAPTPSGIAVKPQVLLAAEFPNLDERVDDPVSLLLAREANVVVTDNQFAAELRDSLHGAITSGAKPIAPEYASHMGLTTRALSWAAYAAVRMLTSISGYGRARDFL